MNKKLVNQISALLLSSAVALGSQAGMTSMVRAADYVQTGNAGSYRYEVWSQNGMDLGNTVFDPDDIYSCSFSGYENVMYRCYRDFSKSRKLTQDYGKITVSYDIDFNIKKGAYQDLTNFYIATYGWTYMPDDDSSANEFYVVDGWGD